MIATEPVEGPLPSKREAERERRRPRPGSLKLGQILETFASAEDQHLRGEPASEDELSRLERELRCRLPESLRAFLGRFGGGLFFHGHEIFGPRRVVIHDIELVPDALAMRRRLEASATLPEGAIPFHRARGVVHLVDSRPESGGERVFSIPPAQPYPDLASFLESVVLPRR
jgi:hypothetical protein